MSDINSSPALKRSFGMREAVTITAGSVIGVGPVSYTHLTLPTKLEV